MKRGLCFVAIMCLLLCSGCNKQDPFKNDNIDFGNLSSSEISAIKIAENELTSTPSAKFCADDVTMVHFTESVKRGLKAEIAIKGEPNTFYSIRVTYSSGASQSKSLVARTSDSQGYISWRWTVGAKTKPGEYPVEIFLNDQLKLKTTLTVTEK